MDYDEFTRVVARYPRVFAPVNHVWHVLRPYADPAVSVCDSCERAATGTSSAARCSRLVARTRSSPRRRRPRLVRLANGSLESDPTRSAASGWFDAPPRKVARETADALRVSPRGSTTAPRERGRRSVEPPHFDPWVLLGRGRDPRGTRGTQRRRRATSGQLRGARRVAAGGGRARAGITPRASSSSTTRVEDKVKNKAGWFAPGFEAEHASSSSRSSSSSDEDTSVTMREIWEALRAAPDPTFAAAVVGASRNEARVGRPASREERRLRAILRPRAPVRIARRLRRWTTTRRRGRVPRRTGCPRTRTPARGLFCAARIAREFGKPTRAALDGGGGGGVAGARGLLADPRPRRHGETRRRRGTRAA